MNERLDATDDLLETDDLLGMPYFVNVKPAPGLWLFLTIDTLTTLFAKLPDLERVLSRIHTGGCKVTDFVKALEALELLLQNIKELADLANRFKSSRLTALVTTGFPDGLEEKLKWFRDAFDHEQALSEDKITPFESYDEVYDDAQVK